MICLFISLLLNLISSNLSTSKGNVISLNPELPLDPDTPSYNCPYLEDKCKLAVNQLLSGLLDVVKKNPSLPVTTYPDPDASLIALKLAEVALNDCTPGAIGVIKARIAL